MCEWDGCQKKRSQIKLQLLLLRQSRRVMGVIFFLVVVLGAITYFFVKI